MHFLPTMVYVRVGVRQKALSSPFGAGRRLMIRSLLTHAFCERLLSAAGKPDDPDLQRGYRYGDAFSRRAGTVIDAVSDMARSTSRDATRDYRPY